LLLFENFSDFVNELREKNEKHQLSRFIAGYAWPWISQNDPNAYDIEIEDNEVDETNEKIHKQIKKELGSCGENVYIGHNVIFTNPKNVHLGNNVRIDPFSLITTALNVGDNVHIC